MRKKQVSFIPDAPLTAARIAYYGGMDTRTLRIALFGIAVVLLAALGFYLWKGTHHGTQGVKKFEGTIYATVVGWDAPSGEHLDGAVSYTPSTGAVSYIKGPQLSSVNLFASTVREAFDPASDRILGTVSATSTLSLVQASLMRQQVTATLDTLSPGSYFQAPVLSKDGTRAAYLVVTIKNQGYPDIYQVSLADKKPVKVGKGIPVAFSPDNSSLLVATSTGLEIASLTTPVRTSVSGSEAFKDAKQIAVSLDRNTVAATDAAGKIQVFTIDWNNRALSSAGQIAAVPGVQAAFTPENEIITYVPGTLSVYEKRGATFGLAGAYSLDLPQYTELIGATISH